MAFPSSRVCLPVLLLALSGLAAEHQIAASAQPRPDTLAQQQARWKVYRAPGIPFEFCYPEGFLLAAHVNSSLGFIFALIKQPGTPWLVDVGFEDRAEYSMDPFDKMSLEEFAVARAQVGCDADSADGTVSCPSVARKQRFKNQNGLEIVELYLNQVNEKYDPPKIDKSIIGPIEAVLLPRGRSGQVLTFKRTESAPPNMISDGLLRQMADSVKLAR